MHLALQSIQNQDGLDFGTIRIISEACLALARDLSELSYRQVGSPEVLIPMTALGCSYLVHGEESRASS